MKKISVTLTTCGRLDLLEETIKSFEKFNSHPIDEFIIICDDPDSKHEIISNYGNEYQIIANDHNLGQKKCLDILFSKCRNDYIFHLEDDWKFDTYTPFIKNSIKILDDNPEIHQVWVRHEYDNPHKSISKDLYTGDVCFRIIDPNFRGCWNGYSWNPGLRRKSDYIKMFPNGICEFKDEMECSKHTRQFDYKVAILKETACYHIGYGRTTQT